VVNESDGNGFRVVAEEDVPPRSADPAKFVGKVEQAEVLPALQEGGLRGHRFAYAPGARSNWHVHAGEQALIVVSGRGLVQWEGLDEPRAVTPGDWVHVRPGVPHWHGAAPDSEFTHLAVTASGGTEWRDPVAEEEYPGAG
jgi:quercetin dioxygenase-like cupin family protein